jgi:hypothetical protein
MHGDSVFSELTPSGRKDASEKISLLPSKPAKPDDSTMPSIWGHAITWILLILILGMSTWVGILYLMPLIEKAYALADDAQIFIDEVKDKFSIMDLVEEQMIDIDKLMPAIKNTVNDINTEVRNVQAIASRTNALLDNSELVLAMILNTTKQFDATLVEMQAQARAMDVILLEANQTQNEMKATQLALAGGL